jgi:hypothetical protein
MSKKEEVKKAGKKGASAPRQNDFADQSEFLAAKKEFLAKKGKK